MWGTMGGEPISGYGQWTLAVGQEWARERWATFEVLSIEITMM